MKHLYWLLAVIFSIVACVAGPATAGPIKIALDTKPDLKQSGTYVWANAFSTYLNSHEMKAEEFQRGALGNEEETLDQVSTGLLEVSQSDVKTVGILNPLIFGVILPYFFEDAAELDKALFEGGMLAKINEGTAKKGVRVLSINHLGLPAGIFNTKHRVTCAADLGDLRMRALDALQIAVFKSWGADATIVAWNEVPNALQTGVAHGYLNPPFVPLLFGHTGFVKYFTDAGVAPSIRLTIASEDWYQGLSKKERGIVDNGVAAANKANREWLAERRGILKVLAEKGVEVTILSPEARAEFYEKSQGIYNKGPVSPEQIAAWNKAKGK